MWKKLSALWALVRGDLRIALRAMRNTATPGWFKLGVLGLGLYLISPIDLIPDFFVGLGMVDDLVIIPAVLRMLISRLPAGIVHEAPRAAPQATARTVRSGADVTDVVSK